MQRGEHQIHRGISNPLEPINCIDFYRIFFVYIYPLYENLLSNFCYYIVLYSPLNVIGNVSEKFWKFEDLSCTLRSEKKFQSFVASKNLVPCANNLLFYIIHIRIIKDINDS